MRRITLQFAPEGNELIVHADALVQIRWRVTPQGGEMMETLVPYEAPWFDLDPVPGVSNAVEASILVNGAEINAVADVLTWPGKPVRMGLSFLMGTT